MPKHYERGKVYEMGPKVSLPWTCPSCGPTDSPNCFVECVCSCHDEKKG